MQRFEGKSWLIAVVLVGFFVWVGLSSEAEAQLLSPTPSSWSGITSFSSAPMAQELSMLSIGRLEAKATDPGGPYPGAGSQRPCGCGGGALIAMIVTPMVLAGILVTVTTIGNLVHMFKRDGHLGWGITGIVVGALALAVGTWMLLAGAGMFSLIALLPGLSNGVMGIRNVVKAVQARSPQKFTALDSPSLAKASVRPFGFAYSF